MKKLTNKKGFTLIEMLVVIAIIAVLVAIIIPVVTNSTVKAAAAANAANMRSLKSEIATSYLQDQTSTNPDLTLTTSGEGANKTTTITLKGSIVYPAMKAVGDYCGKSDGGTTTSGTDAKVAWVITYKNNSVNVTYGGHNIAYYATIAETGNPPA